MNISLKRHSMGLKILLYPFHFSSNISPKFHAICMSLSRDRVLRGRGALNTYLLYMYLNRKNNRNFHLYLLDYRKRFFCQHLENSIRFSVYLVAITFRLRDHVLHSSYVTICTHVIRSFSLCYYKHVNVYM